MSNRRWIAGVAALAGVFGIAHWRGSVRANQELDPLKVAADTHKVLFENALVRVIEAKVPPGKTEPRHRHPRSVTVYMSDYEIEQTTFPEGKKTRAVRKHGTVAWSEPVVHEIFNIGTTALHSIRIELKQ